MNQDNNIKEVYFVQYCKTCTHKDLAEDLDPCDECLAEPARQYSHKPLNYKEAVKKVNKTASVE